MSKKKSKKKNSLRDEALAKIASNVCASFVMLTMAFDDEDDGAPFHVELARIVYAALLEGCAVAGTDSENILEHIEETREMVWKAIKVHENARHHESETAH